MARKSKAEKLDRKSRKNPIHQNNWEKLRSKEARNTERYRDVYERQQLDRTDIEQMETFTSRHILAIVSGVLTFILVWLFIGLIGLFIAGISSMMEGTAAATADNESITGVSQTTTDYGAAYTYVDTIMIQDDPLSGMKQKYQLLDESGNPVPGAIYDNFWDVPVPEWYTAKTTGQTGAESTSEGSVEGVSDAEEPSVLDYLLWAGIPWWWRLLISGALALGVYALLYQFLRRNLDAQNLSKDTSDINQYDNDQHIMLPEEVQREFDWFPDVGAHSSVSVSSMISHMALSNKGLKTVDVAERATEQILDAEGDVLFEKHEILTDDDGVPIVKAEPIIDMDFMEDLFDASGALDDKTVRVYFDPRKIPYNPGNKNRDKLSGYDTVADLINGDWEFPIYEPTRPAGAYIVDTAPVNTMVLAITRAGKGQTVIEPTIDMWLREKEGQNMVVNDPKGELLVKHYVRAVMRGFQPVQFNLINPMKTDIYNPLVLASDAAREGDFAKCLLYVNNIADVFFPLDGGEDPVWPQAANNAFKRAALGLIDYYLEEEREMRILGEKVGISDKLLATRIDQLWGQVTLYNCYQLFVQLTSQKIKNPALEFAKKAKAGEFDGMTPDEYNEALEKVERQATLWEDKPEADQLTLYYNATSHLPVNEMRRKVLDANNSLRAMAGAEKMLASVYGIAITAMAFFTDPTIMTLTSGTPSQNVDLSTLSFPRAIGVRFHADFMERYRLAGLQCRWRCFEDSQFETRLPGKDFEHEDIVSREGWAKGFFKGIFPKDVGYVRLELVNPVTSQLVRTFYFKFMKGYATQLDGRTYVKDQILGEKIVKDGFLTEMRPKKLKSGGRKFVVAKSSFTEKKMVDIGAMPKEADVKTDVIIDTLTRYAEKPKAVFLVTPPHLMSYAKLILILLKQLVDLNFDKSYMTKVTQKPLYKTRYMLDELGNLQSEGHGIDHFETMLSIGLGQDQQFTLILQTLQQLRDVYGDSVDKVVQGNAQVLDSLLATPKGWLRFGDVAVGDEVITYNGKVVCVVGVFPRGTRKVYKVTRRDGSHVTVCGEHLWRARVE